MPCKLGLDNPDKMGGEYTGPGIAKLIYKILWNLREDGLAGKAEAPFIRFQYSDKKREDLDREGADVIGEMFLNDNDYYHVGCVGPQDSDYCDTCPYFQKTDH